MARKKVRKTDFWGIIGGMTGQLATYIDESKFIYIVIAIVITTYIMQYSYS